MFCYKCGTKLAEDAVFCHKCGAKSINSQELEHTPNKKSINKVDSASINSTFIEALGETLEFPPSLVKYIEIRNVYTKKAKQISMNFYNKIDSNYSSLDTFIKNVPNDIDEIYLSFINSITSDLNNRGCFQISDTEILAKMKNHIGAWVDAFDAFTEAYSSLTGEYHELNAYKTMQRNSRGKVVGGGFGIVGAAKGMITAGAINTTTGFFNSIFDSMADSRDKNNFRQNKKQVFKNIDMRQNLTIAIYLDIFMMHYVHVEIINEKLNAQLPIYTVEMYNQAETLYSNIDNERIGQNQVKDAIINLFKLYPFEPKYYELAFLVLDQPIENYKNLMNTFSIDEFDTHEKSIGHSATVLLKNYLVSNYGNQFSTNIQNNIILLNESIKDRESGIKFAYPEKDADMYKFNNMTEKLNVYPGETPLVAYDNTVFGSGAKGFLITNEAVYAKDYGNIFRCPLSDIETILVQLKDNNCWEISFNNYGVMIYESELVNSGYFKEIIEFIIHSTNILGLIRFKKTDSLLELLSSLSNIEVNTQKCMENSQKTNNDSCAESDEIDLTLLIEEIERRIIKPFIDKAEDKSYISSFPNINESKKDAITVTFQMYNINFEEELPIFYYDDGIINIGKNGFLLTNKKLYFHNKEGKWSIDINQVESLQYKMKKFLPSLLLNNSNYIPCKLIGHDTAEAFPELFFNIRNVLQQHCAQ